jgi:hypothetical protein
MALGEQPMSEAKRKSGRSRHFMGGLSNPVVTSVGRLIRVFQRSQVGIF